MSTLRLALVLVLAALAMGGRAAGAQPVAVVVHPDVPVDNLSLGQLRTLFMGVEKRWPNRVPVQLIVRPRGAYERAVMLDRVYRMSESRFQQYWLGLVSRGDASRGQLKTSPSAGAAWRLVQALPGAITLMASGDVPSGARVLRIDGRKPGESGYALQ